jgi:hypothetical protein
MGSVDFSLRVFAAWRMNAKLVDGCSDKLGLSQIVSL